MWQLSIINGWNKKIIVKFKTKSLPELVAKIRKELVHKKQIAQIYNSLFCAKGEPVKLIIIKPIDLVFNDRAVINQIEEKFGKEKVV